MKIAYFTDTFLPKIDGVVTSLLAVSNFLVENGHEVLIIAPKPSRKLLGAKPVLKEGIHVQYIASIPSFFYPDLRAGAPLSHKVVQELRKFNPDVIHFQTTFLIGGGAILLGKILRKPIVGSFHTYFMEPEYIRTVGITDQKNVIRSLLWRYAQVFYNLCDEVVTPAQIVTEDLRSHGVTRPIAVIPNPINESLIQKTTKLQKTELRKKYNLNKHVILYVGRLSREKNVNELIKAFAILVKENPDSSLLLVGDGPAREKLEKMVEELKLEKQVIFAGVIEHSKLFECGVFEIADLFATASTSEVQPVSIIEAMAYGLPLVGVAKRGVQEMVKGVGLLSETEDSKEIAVNLRKVLQDDTLRDKLAKQSLKKFYDTYTSKKIAAEYEQYYKKLIK